MTDAVRNAGDERQRALIDGHPDLAGKAAREGKLTADSTAEQAGAGLDRLSDAGVRRLPSPQRRLPGEVRHAVHRLRAPPRQGIDPARVRAAADNDAATERKTALAEIFRIAALAARSAA